MNIKEATPQNRPNYFRQDMAVRGAVGDLAGNSQVHLLGFSDKLQRLTIETRNRTAANKGFAIAGVPCFADTFVQGGSSVLRMKFSAKTPRHRKPPKRCAKVVKSPIKIELK